MLDRITGSDDNARPHRRTALIALELSRFGVDIAALSETRLSGEGSLAEVGGGYTFFWRGYPEGHPRQHGVGLAIKTELMDKITETPVSISERIITLRVPLAKNENVTILSCYAPTLVSDEDIKDTFYEQLHEALSQVKRDDKIVLLGDFNARVGTDAEVWNGVIGANGVGNMNANGLRLLTLCTEHQLVITNTVFRMKNRYKTSWMHPRSKHWHLIDYVIVRRADLRHVRKTAAIRGAECSTDHRLIASDIAWQLRPRVRRSGVTKRKINCEALHCPVKREEFQSKVAMALNCEIAQPDVQRDNWGSIAGTMREVAEETLGFKTKRHRDWFDENNVEICSLLASKNTAHDALLKNPSSTALKRRFVELRSKVQRELRGMENEWWTNLADEIQGYADENNTHSFYNALKCAYGPIKQSTAPVRSADGTTLIKDKEGISRRWAEHYESLLNGGLLPDQSILDQIPQRPIKDEMDAPPSLQELEECIIALRNHKAAGGDGLPPELFKYGGPSILQKLHNFILNVWEVESVPQVWKDSLLVNIYKNKGDRAVCGNSRGISLLSVAGKLQAKVWLKRLIKHVSEDLMPETQCGFRQNRSTSDMIFAARQTLEKCREQNRQLHMCFIDLSKAFDTVDRTMLWEILRRSGCPNKFVRLIRLIHDGMEARVKVGNLESESFGVSRGVKQGCVLAPVLFNIYISYVTKLLADRVGVNCGIFLNYRMDRSLFDLQKLKARTKTQSAWFLELQYADDCALLAHSQEELQQMVTIAAELYAKFGLEINARKTEVLSWTGENAVTSTSDTLISGTPLVNTDSFKYLGSYISSDCKLDAEINNRICQAARAYGRLQSRVFRNRDLSLRTKMKVYAAVCLSTLLYGSESWTLYARQMRILEAWHTKSLRCMLGVTWRDKLTHEELYRRTDCSSLES